MPCEDFYPAFKNKIQTCFEMDPSGWSQILHMGNKYKFQKR